MANPLLVGPDTHLAVTVGAKQSTPIQPKLPGHMTDLSIRWLRWQPYWNAVETSKGVYNWSGLDKTVSTCNAAGINILVTVLFPPTWWIVNGLPDPNGTLQYAQAICARYDGNHGFGKIQGIELGNEDYDQGAGAPFQPLVNTMNTCYPTLKKAYPNLIIGPGCSLQRNGGHITQFWTGLWQNAGGHFDYANFHFYTDALPLDGPVDPSQDLTVGGRFIPSFASAISIMDSARPSTYKNVPIWCTEFGFPINHNYGRRRPVNPTQQHDYLQYCLDQAKNSGKIDKMFIFTISEVANAPDPGFTGLGDGMSLYQAQTGVDPTPAYTMVKGYNWPVSGGTGTGGGTPNLTIAPTSLAFSSVQGGSNPSAQTVLLTNTGGASAAWTLGASGNLAGVLGASATSGTLAAGANVTLTISVDNTSVSAGTTTATIGISATGGNSVTIAVTSTVTSPSSGGTAGTLPGQVLYNGVSNFIFGTQFPPEYGNPHTAINTPQIQSLIKAGNFQIMRMAVGNGTTGYTDAQIDARINACLACGCVPLVILGHDVGWTFNTHVVTYLGSRCNLYEMYNEPDIHSPAIPWQTYLSDWNTHIPAMRAINPNAAFIGPVLGVVGNFNSYLQPWLAGCKTSGVLPDAVSFHDYPCGSQPTQAVCATKAPNIGHDATALQGIIQQTLGHTLPIAITEWNVDYNTNTVSYAQNNPANQAFMTQWTHDAIDGIVKAGVAIACQFDCANGAENGDADLVSTTTFQPQIQYQPMVDKIKQYLVGGGTTGSPTLSINSTGITFNAVTGGVNPSTQSVLLSNIGTGAASWSESVSPTASWLTISPTSGTLSPGGNTSITLSAATGALTAGTYTTTITFSATGGNSTTLAVSFVVASSGTSSNLITLTLPAQSQIGMNYYNESMGYTTRTQAQIVQDIQTIDLGCNRLKVYFNPLPQNANGIKRNLSLTNVSNIVQTAKAQGLYVVWVENIDQGTVLTDSTTDLTNSATYKWKWSDYAAQVAADAKIAQSAGADEFVVGNQIVGKSHFYATDPGTSVATTIYTATNFPGNVSALVDACRANFNSKIGYQETDTLLTTWINSGLLHLDKLYFALYEKYATFQKQSQLIASNFGTQAEIGEVSTVDTLANIGNYVALTENDWTRLLMHRYFWLKQLNLVFYAFTYVDTTVNSVGYGIRQNTTDNQTFHDIWQYFIGAKSISYVQQFYDLFPPNDFTGGNTATSGELDVDATHTSALASATGTDYVFRGRVRFYGSTGSIRLVARYTDANNYYCLNVDVTNNQIKFIRRQSSTETQLGVTVPWPPSGSSVAALSSSSFTDFDYEMRVSGTGASTSVWASFDSYKVVDATDATSTLTSVKAGLLYVSVNGGLYNVIMQGLETYSTISTVQTKDLAARVRVQSLVSQRTRTLDLAARVGIVYIQDTFIRANQSGWGTASDGETWAQASGTATLSILSNEGKVTGASGVNTMRMGILTPTDVEAVVRFSITTPGDIVGITLRDQGLGTFYRLRLTSSQLQLTQNVNNVFTILKYYAFSASASTFYWMRFRVLGDGTLNVPNLFGKIWADGSVEPSSWSMIASATGVNGGGQVGLAISLGTITDSVLFDHFTVQPPQVGVISSGRTLDLAARAIVGVKSGVQQLDLAARVRVVSASGIQTETFTAKQPPVLRRFPK